MKIEITEYAAHIESAELSEAENEQLVTSYGEILESLIRADYPDADIEISILRGIDGLSEMPEIDGEPTDEFDEHKSQAFEMAGSKSCEAKNTIQDAIERSISHNETVTISGVTPEDVAAEWDGDTDYVEIEEGIDMWGWTDETEENEQDWRIRITG